LSGIKLFNRNDYYIFLYEKKSYQKIKLFYLCL
jgi:hypothetical protein